MFSRRQLLRRPVAATAAAAVDRSSVVTAADIAAMPSPTGPYEQPRVFFKASCDPAKRNTPSVLFGPAPNGVQPIEGPAEGLGAGQLLYKITSPTCDYVSLRLALLRAGFRRIGAGPRTDELPANVVWGKSMPPKQPAEGSPKERAFLSTRLLHPLQKFNHFPSSHANLGCKAGMALNLSRAEAETAHFNPKTLLYPMQRKALTEWIAQSPKHERFIWKPARGSCGRGIFICGGGGGSAAEVRAIEEGIARKVRECEAANTNPAMFKHYVVQRYIDDPLLIDNKKFDLRLYVAVTAFAPRVVAYRHSLGFARFAAAEYAPDADLSEKYSHLTNFSIGRKVFAPPAVPTASASVDGLGDEALLKAAAAAEASAAAKEASEKAAELKWTLDRLNAVLDDEPHRVSGLAPGAAPPNSADMWAAVDDVIRRTLLAAQPRIAKRMQQQDEEMRQKVGGAAAAGGASFQQSYFELYGFDVMFDSNCRPWLIEVNTLPSLESSSVRDYHLKTAVVTDLLNMAMVTPFDRTESERALFATPHHVASYGETSGASGDSTSAAPSDAVPAPTMYPREILSPPSEAASRFLVGATEGERFAPVAVDEASLAMRLQDEDTFKGGFTRIL